MDWPTTTAYRMTVGKPFVSSPNHAEWDDVHFPFGSAVVGMQTYRKFLGRAPSTALHGKGGAVPAVSLFVLSCIPAPRHGSSHRLLDQRCGTSPDTATSGRRHQAISRMVS